MRVQRSTGRRRSIPIILALFCLGLFGSLISVASSDNTYIETIAGPEADGAPKGGNSGGFKGRTGHKINGVGVALIGLEGESSFTVELPYYVSDEASLEQRAPGNFDDVSLGWMMALNNGGVPGSGPGASGGSPGGTPGFAGGFTPLGGLSGPGFSGSGTGTPVGGAPGDSTDEGNKTPEGDNNGNTNNPGDNGTPGNDPGGPGGPGTPPDGPGNPPGGPGNPPGGPGNPPGGPGNPPGGPATPPNGPAPGDTPGGPDTHPGDTLPVDDNEPAEAVPEPGSMAIMLTGLGLFAAITRKRKQAKR